MEKNICKVKGCVNYGKYCRVHLGYSVPAKNTIDKASDKRKEANKQYSKVRAEFLKDHLVCMAQLVGCTKEATQVHHMAGKVNTDLLLNDKLFLAVCFNCHEIIEKNPAFAKQNGLSVSRHSKNVITK